MGQYFSHEHVYHMGQYVDRDDPDLYCQPIKDAFAESSMNIKNIPILDIGDRIGTTDYIDMIEVSEMSHPIMRGCDKFKRPFMAFKLTIQSSAPDDDKSREIVHTLFQRRADNTDAWAWGSSDSPIMGILSTSTYLKKSEYENFASRLKILLTGGTVNSYSRTCITPPDEDPIKGNGRYLVKLSG
jgi:hypothetical protein